MTAVSACCFQSYASKKTLLMSGVCFTAA